MNQIKILKQEENKLGWETRMRIGLTIGCSIPIPPLPFPFLFLLFFLFYLLWNISICFIIISISSFALFVPFHFHLHLHSHLHLSCFTSLSLGMPAFFPQTDSYLPNAVSRKSGWEKKAADRLERFCVHRLLLWW